MLLRHPTFTDNLALLRTSHEYTQQQLTDAMNEMGTFIHRAAYANIERGKRNLKVTDLVCLKTIYNVPYEAFLKESKSTNKDVYTKTELPICTALFLYNSHMITLFKQTIDR